MKLWLLSAREDLKDGNNPWECWYDKSFGFVIRAEDETEARSMADQCGGDEKHTFADAWLSAEYSTCVELTAEGESDIIIDDYRNA